MEKNTQLPDEVVDKIEQEAHDATCALYSPNNYDEFTSFRSGWEKGATAYATKLHQLDEHFKVMSISCNAQLEKIQQLQQENDKLKQQATGHTDDEQLDFSIQRGDLWKHRALSAEKQLEEFKARQGAGWVKASERLPGWRQSVKWKSHEGAEVGKHPLFAMTDPGTAEAMDGWEWLDEQPAAGREEDAVAFAEWLDKERNERTNNYKNISIWGKETAYKIMYDIFKKEGAE